jgi:sugar lactone lactonase YvrE
MPADIVVASPGPFSLGEGCVWDGRLRRLYLIDINGRKIAWLDSDGTTTVRDLDGTPGTVVLTTDPDQLVLALDTGLAVYELSTGAVRLMAPYPEGPDTRFNDGKCDPAGRLWVGTMSREGAHGAGTLYRFRPGGQADPQVPGVTVSNGLCWSRDGLTMFYIDSATREVHAFDFEPTSGTLSGRRTVVTIPPDRGYPDGMTIDSEDRLWVAHWLGSCVACYDPVHGGTVAVVEVPTPRVTSCCFGGDDLRTLFITTAIGSPDGGWTDVSAYPGTGAVFAVCPGAVGMPTFPFRGLTGPA